MDLAKAPATRGLEYGYSQHISVHATELASVDLFEMAEGEAVGELARKVHKDGLQFDGWPKFTRMPMVFSATEGLRQAREELGEEPQMWELRATVWASPHA